MATEYKTGEQAPYSGVYGFNRHTGAVPHCIPTPAEREIPLSRGETFPPHKSCRQGAYWILVRYA